MNYSFSAHAFKRMAERGISPETVKSVIENGLVIREYADDKPYPSRLILGFDSARPIHVVSAFSESDGKEYIITVYEPNAEIWTEDFKEKKQK